MRCARALLMGQLWTCRFPVDVPGEDETRLDRMCREMANEKAILWEVRRIEGAVNQFASWTSGQLRLTTGELLWWFMKGQKRERSHYRSAFFVNQRRAA